MYVLMNLTENGLILVIGSGVAMIGVLFKGFRLSRCHTIDMCCGLIKCQRELLSEDIYKMEADMENQTAPTLPIIKKK